MRAGGQLIIVDLKKLIGSHFPALASRDYAIFWSGQFLSLIGTWMQSTTQPYLAYRLSGNPFDLGLIGMASTLPTFFLALPGGVLVERFDKRKTVIAMQTVMMFQALVLSLLTIFGFIQIWHIILLSLLLGVASSIEITARQAMLVEIVGKSSLPNAIALQATIFQAARVIGPAMMVPFILFIKGNGEGYAFLANAISYAIVITGLTFVRTPFRQEREKTPLRILADLKESLRYISNTREVAMIILMATVFGFIGFPLLQQIPVFGRDVLRVAGEVEGDVASRTSLIFTFVGFGALTSAFSIAAFSPRLKGKLLLAGQVTFSLAVILVSVVTDQRHLLAGFFAVGLGMVSTLATMNTLIQMQVPNQLRGRVFSTYLWGLQGVSPFGSLLIGWSVTQFGVQLTSLSAGVICVFAIATIHALTPGLRKLES